MRELFEFIAQLLRRKLHFIIFTAVVAVIGVAATHGLSWTTMVVATIAVFLVMSAWALFSFWISVFRNTGKRESQ
jgi:membrane associated rhomboid family serine protease